MFDYLHVTLMTTCHYLLTLLFITEDMKKKDKVQLPPQNEMISLCCTVLGFICKNEEYKLENNA